MGQGDVVFCHGGWFLLLGFLDLAFLCEGPSASGEPGVLQREWLLSGSFWFKGFRGREGRSFWCGYGGPGLPRWSGQVPWSWWSTSWLRPSFSLGASRKFGRQGCEAGPGGQGGHLGGGSGSLVANRLAFAMSRCEALQVPLGLGKCLVVLSSGGSYRTLSLL